MGQPSLDREYFEHVYAGTDDPWNFAASPYERDKYRVTLAALDGRHFGTALEIGCSIGVLTAMLAPTCESLLAIDINDRALATARTRCAGLSHVRFARMTFPRDVPGERFDLIVISEVAYYWSDADLRAAIDFTATSGHGGTLELVHFLPKVDDYVRDGDAVHEAFLADGRFEPLHAERAPRYRLDLLHVR